MIDQDDEDLDRRDLASALTFLAVVYGAPMSVAFIVGLAIGWLL